MMTVQACRGTEYDEGVDVTDAQVFSPAKTVLYRLPKEADFLYAYSTTPGTYFVAWMLYVRYHRWLNCHFASLIFYVVNNIYA